MNNTKQIIENHNKRILNSPEHSISTDNSVVNKSCNCRQKNTCPLNGNCLQSSVIYQATVKRNNNNTSETYIGLTESAFKTRYRNHTASFRHTKHRNSRSTELSKHVWSLKDSNIDYSISWRIISSSSSYNSSCKRCNLCLKEKFLIICRPDLSSLNKRNELVSSCRHRNKALLRKAWFPYDRPDRRDRPSRLKNVQTIGTIIWKRYLDDRKRPGRLRRPRSLG